jgi:hypothetical protein
VASAGVICKTENMPSVAETAQGRCSPGECIGAVCGIVTLGFGCLVAACSLPTRTPAPHVLTADEALSVQSRVTDCEWKAANQYDDGSRTISELARQVMGVCSVERTNAELAFGLLNDPQIDSMEFEQAVNSVKSARASRSKPKNSN